MELLEPFEGSTFFRQSILDLKGEFRYKLPAEDIDKEPVLRITSLFLY